MKKIHQQRIEAFKIKFNYVSVLFFIYIKLFYIFNTNIYACIYFHFMIASYHELLY